MKIIILFILMPVLLLVWLLVRLYIAKAADIFLSHALARIPVYTFRILPATVRIIPYLDLDLIYRFVGTIR